MFRIRQRINPRKNRPIRGGKVMEFYGLLAIIVALFIWAIVLSSIVKDLKRKNSNKYDEIERLQKKLSYEKKERMKYEQEAGSLRNKVYDLNKKLNPKPEPKLTLAELTAKKAAEAKTKREERIYGTPSSPARDVFRQPASKRNTDPYYDHSVFTTIADTSDDKPSKSHGDDSDKSSYTPSYTPSKSYSDDSDYGSSSSSSSYSSSSSSSSYDSGSSSSDSGGGGFD